MRIFIDQDLQTNNNYELEAHLANYATNVLRLKNNDQFVVFNGRLPLGEFTVEITRLSKKQLFIKVLHFNEVNNESPLKIRLLQGISRGDRMDYTIQKAVELGVAEFYPLNLERTQVKLNDATRTQKKLSHWQGVCTHALQQSGRTAQIKISEPIKIHQLETINASLKLLPDPTAELSLSDLARQYSQEHSQEHDQEHKKISAINVFIGPEGGFSQNERDYAQSIGYIPIRLGPRILRTETAGLAIISYLQATWGDY